MRGYFSIAQLIRLRRIWLEQNMDIVEIYLRSERVALREERDDKKEEWSHQVQCAQYKASISTEAVVFGLRLIGIFI